MVLSVNCFSTFDDTLDMMEMPHKTTTYMKMHCRSYPMVLSVNCFSTYNETLEQSENVL